MHHREIATLLYSVQEKLRNRTSRTNARTADIDPAARILRSHSKELVYAIIKLIHTHTHKHMHTYVHTYTRTLHMGTYVKITMPLCSHYLLHPRTKAHKIE